MSNPLNIVLLNNGINSQNEMIKDSMLQKLFSFFGVNFSFNVRTFTI